MKFQGGSPAKRRLAVGLAVSLLLSPAILPAGSSGHYHVASASSLRRPHAYSSNRSSRAILRDSHGRIKRSSSARREFKLETGYPHGRKGYVIDHVIPLACGGPDDPSNMQWQTIQEAKAKDKWERKGC